MKKAGSNAKVSDDRIHAIRADLEAALAIAANAALVIDPRTRKMSLTSARQALLYVRDELWPLCSPTGQERVEINAKLGRLKNRLERLGERFG
jgi:hypothetical protein